MKIVGIDGGIASVGWAVVDVDDNAGTFTIPEWFTHVRCT